MRPIEHNPAARRKYCTEFGVNGWNEYTALVHPSDLDHDDVSTLDAKYPFHIYAICQHPRIRLDGPSVQVDHSGVRGQFLIHKGGGVESASFSVPNTVPERPGQAFASVSTSDNGALFCLRGLMGEALACGRSAKLMRSMLPHHEANDLEILYVGKSFGTDGERTAPGRLKAHSTLQRILADMSTSLDHEPELLLLHYQYQSLINIDGISRVYGTTQAQDDAHRREVLGALCDTEPGAEMTSYTEAALIKHLCPRYNTQMYVTFPDACHASYQRLYELDLLELSVTLETQQSPLCCATWSSGAGREGIRLARFDLHDTALRAGMLEFPAPGGHGEPA